MYKMFQSDNISTRWWTPATTEKWAVSSGGEHCLDTAGVTSSNLVSPTIEFRRIPFGILFLSSSVFFASRAKKNKPKPTSSRIKQTGPDAERTYATGTHYKRNSVGQNHPKYKLSERLSAFTFLRSIKRYSNAPCDPLKPRTRNVGIPTRTQTPNTTEAQQST